MNYGRHINLLRADDVQRAFAGAGLEAEMHVVDRLTPQMSLHAHWAENYAPEILAIRTALFVGPALDGGAG